MAIEDIVKEATQIAEKEARERGFNITSVALGEIRDELVRNQEIVEKYLIKEEKTRSDIYESVKKLIYEASYLAKTEKRSTIFYGDIKKAMLKICPTYWPFC